MTTREEWLNELTSAMRPMFQSIGHPLPDKLRVSCGWPTKHALPNKKGIVALGECWYFQCSADQSTELFISPRLSEAPEVARTLAHELCHAANGKACGHRGEFITVAKAVGLQKPWTMTPASAELMAKLATLCEP